MTDDLESMGVDSRVEERSALDGENPLTSLLKKYLQRQVTYRLDASDPPLCSVLADPLYASFAVRYAHAAVLACAPDTRFSMDGCSMFLSAVYRTVPDSVITYDLPFPLDRLGHDLPRGKMLINTGSVGSDFGYRGHGIFVNRGVRGGVAQVYGAFINLQPAGDADSLRPPQWEGSCGLRIDLSRKTVESYGSFSGDVSNWGYTPHGECRESYLCWELYLRPSMSGRDLFLDVYLPKLQESERPWRSDAAERFDSWLCDVDHTLRTDPERFLLKYQGYRGKRRKKQRHIQQKVLRELTHLLFKPEASR